MIVRGALGTPWLFAAAGAGFYAALTLFAGVVVTRSTSTLFALAARQAAANAELRDAVSAARLEALHARLNPHMLFNALNTVAALVRSDPRAAERVVENLGDVLRAGLDRSAAAQTSLGDEIAYVGACLNIERERWGESLRVRWDVPDDLRNVTVPTFVLQPLVENALKHGVGRRLGGGEIAISARADRDALTLAVEDDGPGFGPAWRDGVGLGNLRQRLRALYGGAAALTIEPHASGGHVRVRVPRG
jgi:LytS/YehU family sensor histidine kinase